MIFGVLVKSARGSELRDRRTHDLGIPHEGVTPAASNENPLELNTHTFTCHLVEQRSTRRQCHRRGSIHGEVKAAGKAHGTQHTQRIFLETTTGLPHRANLPTL